MSDRFLAGASPVLLSDTQLCARAKATFGWPTSNALAYVADFNCGLGFTYHYLTIPPLFQTLHCKPFFSRSKKLNCTTFVSVQTEIYSRAIPVGFHAHLLPYDVG